MKSAEFPPFMLPKQRKLLPEDSIQGSRDTPSSHRRLLSSDRIPLIAPQDLSDRI